MDTFMIVWVVVQIFIIGLTVWLLIKMHKPKQSTLEQQDENNKNGDK